MKITTDYIGEIEYLEEEIIKFPDGIFGFEDQKNFVVVGEILKEFPFVWLQSVDDPNVVFVLTEPFLFVENYDFSLSDEAVSKLEASKAEDLQIYTICVVPDNANDTTINLKSPIAINVEKRIGVQVILDEDLPYKHRLFKNA